MADEAAAGRAVPLFDVDPDSGCLELQEAALEQILLSDDVRDALVIPVSITGAFRRGKSFLLNVLLRFLQSDGDGGGDGDWLAADDATAPLSGFPWRGGRQAHTRGLQLWSRPLPVTLADGRPARVLLLDTQGAFDDVSTPRESVTVRALAGLLSAVQVFNVSRQLQSDDLHQARLCAEYGRLLAEAAGSSAGAQRLVVLVRDWAFPEDAPYGSDGGRRVVADWLVGDDDGGVGTVTDSGLAVEELECFLLPFPGAAAAGGGAEFTGAISQLAEEFAAQLRLLAPWLLGDDRLVAREVDGQPLTGASLAALCRALAAAADTPPELENLADGLAATAARRAREKALQTYCARLKAGTDVSKPLSDSDLLKVHQAAEEEARRVLTSSPAVGRLSHDQTLGPLTTAIQEQFERARLLNAQQRSLCEARADSHNTALSEAARGMYEAAMQRALPADGPSVADVTLRESHAAAVRSALEHYDGGRDPAGPTAGKQREALQRQVESQLTAHLARNGALRKREETAAAAAAAEAAHQQAQAALQQAQAQYECQMAPAAELAEPAVRQAHQAAAAAAAEATAGAAGQAAISAWLAAQLEQRLGPAREREKQELQRKAAQAAAQLRAVQEAQAAANGRRRKYLRIGGAKIRLR